MKKIKNTEKIHVLGTTFKNIGEAIAYAVHGEPKDGVYVGEDSQRYPCFDSDDYATEDRYYWNLVFAKSEGELKEKLEKLKALPSQCNYDKFTESLAPMAYWEGDRYFDVVITDDIL